MDIHKPKPWRGGREFAKEVGTIVLGVLIPLGAEAVVEKLHEQRISNEARDAVRAEINLDLANMKRRDTMEACYARRFAELGDFIAKAEAREPFPLPLTIASPPWHIVYTQRWEAAAAGGRASLLSSDEQRSFARVYANLELFRQYENVELEAWTVLMGLEGVTHPSDELLARARSALGKARIADFRANGALLEAEDRAARIGIKGEDAQLIRGKDRPEPFCLAMATTPAERAKVKDVYPM